MWQPVGSAPLHLRTASNSPLSLYHLASRRLFLGFWASRVFISLVPHSMHCFPPLPVIPFSILPMAHQNIPVCSSPLVSPASLCLGSFRSFMALLDPPWREGQGEGWIDQGGDPGRAQGAPQWAGVMAKDGHGGLQPGDPVAPTSTQVWKYPSLPPLQPWAHFCFSHTCVLVVCFL